MTRRFGEYASRQAEVWGAAPWERVAELNAPSHDRLVEKLEAGPGVRWLDVATGTGGVALRAARRGAKVTGIDLAPNLVETARRLAAEEGLDVQFDVGDAEALPYEDAAFDVVSSAFGVFLAPDQEAAAAELARVVRPGGSLGLTTIHPDSSGANMWRIVWQYDPLPEGAGDPIAWGREGHVQALLGEAFELEIEKVEVERQIPDDPEQAWGFFSTSAGPAKHLVDTLSPDRLAAFKADWLEHIMGGRPRSYLLVLGTRR